MGALLVFTIALATPDHKRSAAYAEPPLRWDQESKLTIPGPDSDSWYGESVAIDNRYILIGARGSGSDRLGGSAFLYDRPTETLLHELVPSLGVNGNYFGKSVLLAPEVAIVGAPFDPDFGGSVRLFDLRSGAEVFTIDPSGPPNLGGYFGWSMDRDGDLLLIGSPTSGVFGPNGGGAFLFDLQTLTLDPQGFAGVDYHWMGVDVAIADGLAAVGGVGDPSSQSPIGTVRVFDVATHQLRYELKPDRGGSFGQAVDLADGILAIGQPRRWYVPGAVTLVDALTGQQIGLIESAFSDDDDHFGESLTISGDRLIVGAPLAYHKGVRTGTAHIFRLSTREQEAHLTIEDGDDLDRFGVSVAAADDGHSVLVGASWQYLSGLWWSGATYRFEAVPVTLAISPQPLTANADAVFELTSAPPHERTWMLYSVEGLADEGIWLPRLGVSTRLDGPKIAFGPRLTDAEGNLTVHCRMPDILRGVDVWFQAVQSEWASNHIATQIRAH